MVTQDFKIGTVILEAVEYTDISAHTPVINSTSVPYFIYVHIPEPICKDIKLYEICNAYGVPLGHVLDDIVRDDNRPWLKVPSTIFDTTAGQHVYQLSFVNVKTNDIVLLYISYIVQDDAPEKPYIYMRDTGV